MQRPRGQRECGSFHLFGGEYERQGLGTRGDRRGPGGKQGDREALNRFSRQQTRFLYQKDHSGHNVETGWGGHVGGRQQPGGEVVVTQTRQRVRAGEDGERQMNSGLMEGREGRTDCV